MGNCCSKLEAATKESPSGTQKPFYANAASLIAKKGTEVVRAKMRGANIQFSRAPPTQAYNAESEKTIPGVIRMISGCKDTQTSADVSDVSSFGLPIPDPREKAGGACTNGLLHTLQHTSGNITFGKLLMEMQKTLKSRGYTQIPQLSSSRNSKLQEDPFTVWNPINKSGRTRALLIGINYFGSKGQLNGCINDVMMIKNYLISQGYSSNKTDMRVLTDDGKNDGMPTGIEIVRGLRWLTEGAAAGDSFFLHYSGHGTQMKDMDGDEADGFDEAIVPSDYEKNGLVLDDTIFQLLAGGLPHDAHLVCVFDCCHSGTVMDLPYIFSATGEAVHAIEEGEQLQMQANPAFNMEFAQQLLGAIARGVLNQIIKSQMNGAQGTGGTKTPGGGASSSLQSEMFKVAQQFLQK